ncbi:MAG TPA: hypothetical protein PLV82_02330 [bacterium]|nr:hypothetical protein [bacterium]
MFNKGRDEENNISVWLDESGDDVKSFYCCVCGHKCFEYHGKVKLIVQGASNAGRQLVVQCKGTIFKKDYYGGVMPVKCKTKYWIG